MPIAQARSELAARIEAGRELAVTQIPSLEGGPVGLNYSGRARFEGGQPAELRSLREHVSQWRDYNRTWLDRNLGGEAAAEYRSTSTHWGFGGADNPRTDLRFLRENIESEVSKLQSISDRLDMWSAGENLTTSSGALLKPSEDSPVFIVHGSDTLRAERVARVVKEATGRETIILREQANLGQTLIEKFERHAAAASYAIVVLTADDEGGRKDQGERRPRGRQNVVFEMGYFFGILGRSRVSVLLRPGVEKPSDMDGIVYIAFSDDDAWKLELFRELEHASIHVDMARVV